MVGARGRLLPALLPALFPFGLAQGKLSLLLTPARLELKGADEGTARLSNTGEEEVAFEVAPFPFLLRLDGALWASSSHDRDLCPHLEVLPQGRVSLGKGESLTVRIRIRPFTGRGTYFCAVGFTTLPPKGEGGGLQVLTRFRLVLPVYVTFPGTEEPRLEVSALGRKGVASPQGGEHREELYVLLRNGGNTLLRVKGTLLFYDREGKEAGRLSVAQGDGLPILPGGSRLLSFRPELPPGGYRVLLLLEDGYGRLAVEGEW